MGSEDDLVRCVVRELRQLYPSAEVVTEYAVHPRFSQFGVGDVRATLEHVVYVIEVKYIDPQGTGKTARARRTRHRRYVRAQAIKYASWAKLKDGSNNRRVVACVFTNEGGLEVVRKAMTYDESFDQAIRSVVELNQSHVWDELISSLRQMQHEYQSAHQT